VIFSDYSNQLEAQNNGKPEPLKSKKSACFKALEFCLAPADANSLNNSKRRKPKMTLEKAKELIGQRVLINSKYFHGVELEVAGILHPRGSPFKEVFSMVDKRDGRIAGYWQGCTKITILD